MKPSTDPKYKYYLHDLGYEIRDRALEAKAQQDAAKEEGKDSAAYNFYSGRSQGYYEVVSLMQQMAVGFDMDLKDINLQGINPDKDLI